MKNAIILFLVFFLFLVFEINGVPSSNDLIKENWCRSKCLDNDRFNDWTEWCVGGGRCSWKFDCQKECKCLEFGDIDGYNPSTSEDYELQYKCSGTETECFSNNETNNTCYNDFIKCVKNVNLTPVYKCIKARPKRIYDRFFKND